MPASSVETDLNSSPRVVRALAFRFEAFGRPVKTALVKKFEEGIFSDLRNLKPGEDSSLEKPKVSRVSLDERLLTSLTAEMLPIERIPGPALQIWLHSNAKEAKGVLLVSQSMTLRGPLLVV